MMPFVVLKFSWNAVTWAVTLFYVVFGGSVFVSRGGSFLVSGEDQWVLVADIGPNTIDKIISAPLASLSLFALFIQDGVPPVTALKFIDGVQFTSPQEQLFASTSTRYLLEATDPQFGSFSGSGVEVTEFRIDSAIAPFIPFTQSLSLNPGFHTIQFRSIDRAGNIEAVRSAIISVDGAAPSVEFSSLEPTAPLDEGIVILSTATPGGGDPELIVEINDPLVSGGPKGAGSGVASVSFSLDGGSFTVAGSSFTVALSPGSHLIGLIATDNVGNVLDRSTAPFRILVGDILPPRTTLGIGASSAPAVSISTPGVDAVFVRKDTPLSLSSVDDLNQIGDGAGLGTTFQEVLINGNPWGRFDNDAPSVGQMFVSTFALASEPDGLFAVSFFAEDTIANREAPRISTIAVDNTAPESQLMLGGPVFTDPAGKRFIAARTSVTFAGADPVTGGVASGLDRILFSVDVGSFSVFTSSFTLAEGIRQVGRKAMDRLGNTEDVKTDELYVDGTPPITELETSQPFFVDSFGRSFANDDVIYRLDAEDPLSAGVASGLSFSLLRIVPLTVAGGIVMPPSPQDLAKILFQLFDASTGTFQLGEGAFRPEFRSEDKVFNRELLKSATVFVDATPPVSDLVVLGTSCARSDGLVVSSQTAFTLSAVDPESKGFASGLKHGSFKTNGTNFLTKDFRTGQTFPFFLPGGLPDGPAELRFFSVDNVSNMEALKSETVVMDNTPPQAFFISPTTTTANPGLCKLVGGALVKIIGTLRDITGTGADHFESYTLEVGFGADPLSFSVIASSAPERSLEEEVLGVWQTANLPEGVYTLKLTARDCVGNKSVATIQVILAAPKLVLKLGQIGNGLGEFNQPSYIAIDPNTRDVWVTDMNNDRVQKFDSSGTFVLQISEFGKPKVNKKGKIIPNSGDSFNKPSGVAVDAVGDVWVADRNNNRLLKFSTTGQFLLEVKPGLNKPHGVALDTQGNVLVADRNNDRVLKISTMGVVLQTINTGIGGDGLNKPQGTLAVGPEDELFITDRNNDRVLVFSSTGTFLRQLGAGSGKGPGQFNKPDGIAVNGIGFFYVADANNSRVQKFDPYGNVVLIFDTPSNDTEALNHPGGLAVDPDGNLWVADANNGRVKKFAPEGDLLVIASQGEGEKGSGKKVSKMIAKSKGGRVTHPKGAQVEIPAEALPEDLEVTVEPKDSAPGAAALVTLQGHTRKVAALGEGIEFGPEGTEFGSPVTLTLPYDAAGTSNESSLVIGYWNPSTGAWEPLATTVDRVAKVVRAQTTHFSLYAVLGPSTADAAFALGEVYVYPNPATHGAVPIFHIEAGIADRVKIRIYNVAGQLGHETELIGAPPVIDDGQGAEYAYEYPWRERIPSGMYLYSIEAEKAGQGKLRKTGRFAVVR